MPAIFAFKCSSCSEIHEGSPSIGFKAPAPFLEQSDEIRSAGALSEDFCTYRDEDGQHYFIRTILEIPIVGIEDPFLWGVWVSVSQKSYDRYRETYNNPDTADCYFGLLCNYLPGYDNTYALRMDVFPQEGRSRPLLRPQKAEHTLARDYIEGISIARAQEIAETCMHTGK